MKRFIWTEERLKFLNDNLFVLTNGEIAEALGVSKDTVKRELRRQRANLTIPEGFTPIPDHSEYAVNQEGLIIRSKTGKFLKPSVDKRGYHRVEIKGRKRSVHKIVATTFIPIPKELQGVEDIQVNHLDGDKSNNSVSNLEWATCIQNIHHAMENGLRDEMPKLVRKRQTGETNSSAKLTEKDVLEIYEHILNSYSDQDISKMYPVSRSMVTMIRLGKSWEHLHHNLTERSSTSCEA